MELRGKNRQVVKKEKKKQTKKKKKKKKKERLSKKKSRKQVWIFLYKFCMAGRGEASGGDNEGRVSLKLTSRFPWVVGKRINFNETKLKNAQE